MEDVSDFFSVESLLVPAAVAAAAVLLVRWKNSSKSTDPIAPMPPTGPTFNEFAQVIQRRSLASNERVWAKLYGKIYTIQSPFKLLIPNIVHVGDANVAKQLLIESQKTNPRRFIQRDPLIQNAIAQGEGASMTAMDNANPEWKWRKNAYLKEFHRRRMHEDGRGLLDIVVETGHRFLDNLNAQKDNGPVEIDVLTTEMAANVVLFLLFGKNIRFDAKEFGQSAYIMLCHVVYVATTPWHRLLRHVPFTSSRAHDRARDAAWESIDATLAPEIQKVLDELDGKTKPPNDDRRPGSALVSMIQKEPRFREDFETLVSDIRVFALAGFETTAHGLSFAFGMLAKHPEWGDAIAKEGKSVWKLLKSDPRKALDQAPTASYFFLETLRLYPVVPALPGRMLEDVEVTTKDGTTYGLEKGSSILFMNMVLNRDCGDNFDPSRWDTDPQPFLNTFNTGPHVCPGKNLSILEAHVFLLMAATKFEFFFPGETPETLEYLPTALLKPKDGMPLVVKERVW